MGLEKSKFGWRDIIYLITIVVGISLWFIDREVTKNNHKNEMTNYITNTNGSLKSINEELGQLTKFQESQTELNSWVIYHMKDKNIHKNMSNEEGN